MKTLSHYQKLREDYACIIPKTAPAYELIEAIDDLIKHLQPVEELPHFLGVPVNLPLGWGIQYYTSTDIIVLRDDNGFVKGEVYRSIKNEYVIHWAGEYAVTLNTQKEAIEWLNNKANKS